MISLASCSSEAAEHSGMGLDRQWVEEQLLVLNRVLRSDSVKNSALFEPTQGFYGLLGSGEDRDLERGVSLVARHPTVTFCLLGQVPSAVYLAPREGHPGVGGRIVGGPARWQIQVPFALIGDALAIGTVIAHELGHYILAMEHHVIANHAENEAVTDLTAVAVGLGKLLLNGKVYAPSAHSPFQHTLGHLPLDLTAFAFERVSRRWGIGPAEQRRNLTQRALASLGP